MNNVILLCVTAGFFFGVAPLVGRLSSVNAMLMALLIAAGTFAVTLPVAFTQNLAAADWKALTFGLVGGVINGIGIIAFYRLVAGANEGLWEMSKVLPVALVLIPIVTTIGAIIFFGEALSVHKIIGIVLACGAIWFLS